MPARSMPTCTKFTSSGSFSAGWRSVHRRRAQRPTTRPYSRPYCGMFSTGSWKPKKQVPAHGRSVNRMYCSTRGMLPERAALGRSSRLRLRARRIVRRPSQKAGRNASGGCGWFTQVRTAATRIGLLSSTPRSILFRNWAWRTSPLGRLSVETSESPGFIATGSFWISPGVEPVPHAVIVGDLHPRGRIEHEAVADALSLRALLVHLVQLASGDLAAVERPGVDRLDRHWIHDVPVAVDEMAHPRGLVESPVDRGQELSQFGGKN